MAVTIYLAGAIRDRVLADLAWRDEMCCALEHYASAGLVHLFNPHRANEFVSLQAEVGSRRSKAADRYIFDVDLSAVQQSDVLVANFLSLADGYPSMETFIEWGLSLAQRILRFAIWPEGVELHPFIEQSVTLLFRSPDAVTEFLERAIPHWAGIVHPDLSPLQRELFRGVSPKDCAQA